MKNTNCLPLTLESDTFKALKTDFDRILLDTLRKMEDKGADTAEIALKLSVSLEEKHTESVFGQEEVTVPSFFHTIQSVLQMKTKLTGGLYKNDYRLVYDKNLGNYVMELVEDGQTSLFDASQAQGYGYD